MQSGHKRVGTPDAARAPRARRMCISPRPVGAPRDHFRPLPRGGMRSAYNGVKREQSWRRRHLVTPIGSEVLRSSAANIRAPLSDALDALRVLMLAHFRERALHDWLTSATSATPASSPPSRLHRLATLPTAPNAPNGAWLSRLNPFPPVTPQVGSLLSS